MNKNGAVVLEMPKLSFVMPTQAYSHSQSPRRLIMSCVILPKGMEFARMSTALHSLDFFQLPFEGVLSGIPRFTRLDPVSLCFTSLVIYHVNLWEASEIRKRLERDLRNPAHETNGSLSHSGMTRVGDNIEPNCLTLYHHHEVSPR